MKSRPFSFRHHIQLARHFTARIQWNVSSSAILLVTSIDTSFASASRLTDDKVKSTVSREWMSEEVRNKNDLNGKTYIIICNQNLICALQVAMQKWNETKRNETKRERNIYLFVLIAR